MSTTFVVNDLTIHRIVESECGYAPIFRFFPELTASQLEENRPWLEPSGYDAATGELVLCFQSYVVQTPRHNVLIDACIGNDKTFDSYPAWNRKTDQAWMRALDAAGLAPEDIDYVLCTHLHGDHVGWNTRLEGGRWVPTFPRARYLFSEKEYAAWSGERTQAGSMLDPIRESVLPVIEAGQAELVSSEHELDEHIRLVSAAGHTPDHFAICAGKGADDAFFTGDLIHSPLQARYPELATRVETDREQAIATRRRFLERYCDTATLWCTMHFPSPSVGHVEPWGEGFRLRHLGETPKR